MTISARRFATATLAALTPLAALSIATAAPSFAACTTGQTEINGSCMDPCKKSEVRNADSGNCQTLLSAALSKAETPALSKLTPEQLGGTARVAQQAWSLPGTTGATFGVVNGALDIPVSLAAAAGDTSAAVVVLSQYLGAAGYGPQVPLNAASDVARVAQALPAPQMPQLPKIGFPKVGLPEGLPNVGLPKIGLPEVGLPKIGPPQIGFPKVGLPKIGLPKIGPPKLFGLCGPKLLFFKPCI